MKKLRSSRRRDAEPNHCCVEAALSREREGASLTETPQEGRHGGRRRDPPDAPREDPPRNQLKAFGKSLLAAALLGRYEEVFLSVSTLTRLVFELMVRALKKRGALVRAGSPHP